jgi:hypothetical protein
MNNLELKLIRYDESNENVEAIKGKYGQKGEQKAVFTVLKNLLIINLLNGAKYDSLKLPEVYDGYIQCSNGSRIQVKDSTLTCSLPSDVNGFGIFVLKAWN